MMEKDLLGGQGISSLKESIRRMDAPSFLDTCRNRVLRSLVLSELRDCTPTSDRCTQANFFCHLGTSFYVECGQKAEKENAKA